MEQSCQFQVFGQKIPDSGFRTFLVVAVHFVRPDSGVFRFASGVDAFLLVDLHPLVALELERLVVATTFSAIQFQHSRRSVAGDAHRVPLAVVDGDGRQPQVPLIRPQAVQIEAEAQPAVFDLQNLNKICIKVFGRKIFFEKLPRGFRTRARADPRRGLRLPGARRTRV